MKKIIIMSLILSLVIITSGCSPNTKNTNNQEKPNSNTNESNEPLNINAEEKNAECIKYNNGLRNGSCTEDAPSYCTTVYYPPACKGCQDGQGCGYEK